MAAEWMRFKSPDGAIGSWQTNQAVLFREPVGSAWKRLGLSATEAGVLTLLRTKRSRWRRYIGRDRLGLESSSSSKPKPLPVCLSDNWQQSLAMIRELVAHELPLAAIAARLNKAGLRNTKGQPWRPSTVSCVLQSLGLGSGRACHGRTVSRGGVEIATTDGADILTQKVWRLGRVAAYRLRHLETEAERIHPLGTNVRDTIFDSPLSVREIVQAVLDRRSELTAAEQRAVLAKFETTPCGEAS